MGLVVVITSWGCYKIPSMPQPPLPRCFHLLPGLTASMDPGGLLAVLWIHQGHSSLSALALALLFVRTLFFQVPTWVILSPSPLLKHHLSKPCSSHWCPSQPNPDLVFFFFFLIPIVLLPLTRYIVYIFLRFIVFCRFPLAYWTLQESRNICFVYWYYFKYLEHAGHLLQVISK